MNSVQQTSQTATAALRITGLSFAYLNQPPLIADLDLAIPEGQKVGLIGHNGSGKTTLFLLIGGVFEPTAGQICVVGQPIRPGCFYPEIGLVFQNPDDQLFTTSVRDDVAFGPQNMNLSPQEVERRVCQALTATGVSELIDRVPQQLSGGEKTMVAIASVLSMGPQLMLYDEPSANLDLRARRRLIRFLQAAPETVLLSSHDLELIREVCDRVLLLNRGQIVADGSPQDVMANRELMEANGLEVPYSLET